jgi:aspartate/methionine/tyrosine aminotransferase
MWESERKQRKKPLSKSAIKLQIGKMKGHTEKEVIEAIQASIEKGWATIYPKKEITTNEPRSIYEPAKPRSIYD